MPTYVAAILGVLAAIACTVLMFIMVLPEKKRDTLPKFFVLVHDFFNFKILVVEYLLKGIYMLATFFSLGYGFFLLFSGTTDLWTGKFQSSAGTGLLVMIVGPVVIRLLYEFTMMFLILVKNTTQINKKMPKDNQ